MEVWNRFFSVENQNEDYIEDDILQEAQTVANIVNAGVEKGTYSELVAQLNTLSNLGISRKKYISESSSLLTDMWSIIICVLLSVVDFSCILIFIGTLLYSDIFDWGVLIGIIVALVLIVLNSVIIATTVLRIQFNRRYNIYMKDLRFKNIEIIDDLVVYSKIKREVVIKDLQKTVKLKLIPQGHFCCDDSIFILSDEAYEQYRKKQTLYDQYYREQIEQRLKMKERTKRIQEILNQGQQYVDKIQKSNGIIKDKILLKEIDRMESIVSVIFCEVDISPQYADKLGILMNCYLSAIEKLVGVYTERDIKKVGDEISKNTKKDIENTIDKIINSFEGLLDKFYQEKEMDIATDISIIEIQKKREIY